MEMSFYMLAICKKEFFALFRGYKSVFILVVFIGFSYFIADVVGENLNHLSSDGLSQIEMGSPYAAGLRFLVIGLGFLFVCLLSHDIVNKEIETQTIRFLVTKSSRSSIILGKYLGIVLFWSTILCLSYIPIVFVSKTIDIHLLGSLVCFVSFVISWTILLSTIIYRSSYTLLVGIITSILYPVVGVLSLAKNGVIWGILRYLTPYYYLLLKGYWILLPLLISLLLVFVATIIFARKDL
jgi:ABC-2 type transport system permease protein